MYNRICISLTMFFSVVMSMEQNSSLVSDPTNPLSMIKMIQTSCATKKYDDALSLYARALLRIELDWASVTNKKSCNVPKLFMHTINEIDSFFVIYQKEQSDSVCRAKSLEALSWLEQHLKEGKVGDLSWIDTFLTQIHHQGEKCTIDTNYATLRTKMIELFRTDLEAAEKTPPLRRATH